MNEEGWTTPEAKTSGRPPGGWLHVCPRVIALRWTTEVRSFTHFVVVRYSGLKLKTEHGVLVLIRVATA